METERTPIVTDDTSIASNPPARTEQDPYSVYRSRIEMTSIILPSKDSSFDNIQEIVPNTDQIDPRPFPGGALSLTNNPNTFDPPPDLDDQLPLQDSPYHPNWR